MMEVVMTIGLLTLLTAATSAQEDFKDHGIGVPLAERRGVVATRSAGGQNLAIACSLDLSKRGWILVTDIDTGKTQQIRCPEDVPNSPPYGSLLSKSGKFYTAEGGVFLEFDPATLQWTFYGTPAPGEGCYLSMTEDVGGIVYAGGCPLTHLIAFDPKTRKMTDYGRMDPEEAYLSFLALDDKGWIYCGIGTSRYNIVAFNLETKERRQIVKEEDRKIGTATVYPGTDGKVYGQAGDLWYRLYEGQGTPISREEAAPKAAIGSIYWGDILVPFPDGRKIRAYDIEDKWLEIEDASGQVKRIVFDYESDGSYITALGAGPDGMVYGCSGHPCRAIAYNPKTDKLEYRPGFIYWQTATAQGSFVVASEYPGGNLYVYDPSRPWDLSGKPETNNPKRVAHYAPDINAPTATLAHPDGQHVFMSGMPGYGYRGGGVGVYNLSTNESFLIPHQDLIPEHSTVSMRALPDGTVVCGTSIAGGHGAKAVATEAVLYILDWKAKKVTYQTVPVSGAGEIQVIETDADGLVYGIASGPVLFVFDPQKKEVIHREKLADYGSTVRDGLTRGPDGTIYALFTKAIVKITPKTFRHEKLADTPGSISRGGALVDGRFYFVIGPHLWSYRLPGG